MNVSTDTSTQELTQRLPKWYCYMCNLELFTDEEAKLHIHTDEIVREVLDIVALIEFTKQHETPQIKLTNEVIDFNEAHDDKQSVIYQDDE